MEHACLIGNWCEARPTRFEAEKDSDTPAGRCGRRQHSRGGGGGVRLRHRWLNAKWRRGLWRWVTFDHVMNEPELINRFTAEYMDSWLARREI